MAAIWTDKTKHWKNAVVFFTHSRGSPPYRRRRTGAIPGGIELLLDGNMFYFRIITAIFSTKNSKIKLNIIQPTTLMMKRKMPSTSNCLKSLIKQGRKT